jgi:hypothetical protein
VTFSRPIIDIVAVAVINSAIAPLFVVLSPGQACGRKSAVGVELSEGPNGVGGQMSLTAAVRCCTVGVGDRHGGPHLA